MSCDEYSIRVEDLSKRYEIYAQPSDRLKQMVLPRLQRAAHRPARAYFNEFWALRGVNFKVKRGETVGIVGRNGSGKSTLLQMICGTLTPTLGQIAVNGRIAALLELGAGFNPEFTGKENVRLSGLLYGLSDEELRQRYDTILDFAEIGDFIDQPVKTYSSGMYVRLAFAVAINVSPDILVVDEALSVGDEAFQRKCFARIDEIRAAGATVLFVSHSASTIVQLCDRALMLDAGELVMDGRPKHVVAAYQRLLYAPFKERVFIRAAMMAAARDRDNAASVGGSLATDDFGAGNAAIARTDLSAVERYDPGLIPQSTVDYASHGAAIIDPHFVNTSGRRVNVLLPGGDYIYKYVVEFTAPATRVSFGMMIKSITGVELFGMNSHADGRSIESVRPGEKFEVEFKFSSKFLPGTYFTNAGCNGCSDRGEVGFLHRIVDSTMFKIEVKGTDRAKAGFYDLAVEPSCDIHAVAPV